ncbi:MAG: YceI family protein [Gemmatimonadetes bacterium]|nr:YceI family protein [Gemmatimonadota bacterium]
MITACRRLPSLAVRSFLLAASSLGPPLASQDAAAQVAGNDSAIYIIAPTSRLDVKTGKAGLLGFAGHEHLIRARGFAGRVVYVRNDPAASRVEIAVRADSLEVLTPPDTAEIRQVTAAMRSEVLDVARYPDIRFVSTRATPSRGGFHLQGELTIHGRTRPVAVDVETQVGEDTLRANGRFSVRQTDFGIRPYRGGPAGTVRVADRIDFELHVVATGEPTR